MDDRSWTITDGGFDTGGKFVTVWRTTSASESITLPLRSGYNYNFTVDWGDGSAVETVTAYGDTDKTHTYTDAGDYTVIIDGTVEAWHFNNSGSKDNLIEVLDLGDVGWKNLEKAFYGCSNLTTFEGGDVSGVTHMAEMFRGATSTNPDISGWDTSQVTSMSLMFSNATSANPDVSGWDTSQVTSMSYMFYDAGSAEPDMSQWDFGSVTSMLSMFGNTSLPTGKLQCDAQPHRRHLLKK